jgi:hypothetical protein
MHSPPLPSSPSSENPEGALGNIRNDALVDREPPKRQWSPASITPPTHETADEQTITDLSRIPLAVTRR